MIKTQKLVPSVYYDESRDFQLLGRLFDFVFNSVKTNIDAMQNLTLSINSDIRLLELMTKTVGFETKHDYDVNDLFAICRDFKNIMKKKGTKESIEECVKVLMNAQNITDDCQVIEEVSSIGGTSERLYNIKILIPYSLKDTILLEDLLDYVLPAGFTYSIIRAVVQSNDYINKIIAKVQEPEFEDVDAEEYATITDNDRTTKNATVNTGAIWTDDYEN